MQFVGTTQVKKNEGTTLELFLTENYDYHARNQGNIEISGKFCAQTNRSTVHMQSISFTRYQHT